MARHIDYQVENRKAVTYNVTKECGTVADVRTAFNRTQELCYAGMCALPGILWTVGEITDILLAILVHLQYVQCIYKYNVYVRTCSYMKHYNNTLGYYMFIFLSSSCGYVSMRVVKVYLSP